MSINLQGHILNKRQLDAITPVLNEFMHGRIKGKKALDKACIDALDKAGCPLGYDTGLDRSGTVEERARNWIVNGRVGMSSKAIWSHMTGTESRGYSHPYDPDDLNRCLLLLDLIPEWRPRMPEMAQRSPEWSGLAARWDEIVQCFLEEVGLNWSKGDDLRASKTYAMMKEALGERV